ncbi:hypothetical protein [Gymnodinialimonas hymeniacidonis]|uniref:hypothetical protein n=1 Tax=Gymnodinialimonas hymeniacidonis TaxID=3126508 RepID=UPI0034C63026
MSDDYDWTRHLQEGEEVLWQGRPSLARSALELPKINILNGIIFLAMVPIVFIITPSNPGQQVGDPRLIMAIMFAFGALILWLPMLRFLETRRRTRFALTSKRVMITRLSGKRYFGEKRLYSGMAISIHGSSFGEVHFERDQVSPGFWASLVGKNRNDNRFAFRAIKNPYQVFQLARQAIERLEK